MFFIKHQIILVIKAKNFYNVNSEGTPLVIRANNLKLGTHTYTQSRGIEYKIHLKLETEITSHKLIHC